MRPLFGLTERLAGISCHRFTRLSMEPGFGSVSAIPYLIRTDTESLAVLERTILTVWFTVSFTADISFNIKRGRMCRPQHLPRLTQQCFWRPDVVFPDAILDVD